ncbi:Tfp pilus assembly protein FimT/FimU [Pseudomonas tritici]|uniref:pilus assembly FimT family protein n=1 Tax=Pseudomonas tritici TaxID=2745518 RepID=UPI00387A9051
MHHRQAGFTLLEVMVVMAVMGIISAFMIPYIAEPIRNAKIKGSVEQAKEVVAACNLVRMTPVSSTRNPVTLVVTHVYHSDYTSWTPVATLKSMLSADYPLPTENSFNRPIYFKMVERSCSVAVELDGLIDGWEGYATETDGARTRIIVRNSTRSTSGPVWVQHQKRFLTGESVR